MPPTHFYNEGWMLRLVLDRFAALGERKDKHPLSIPEGCRWYTEALLPSAFLGQTRGDSRAETWTHADSVIGHFHTGKGHRANLTLASDARHFVVVEAKMFSKLSQGVKNALFFNQAARNIACIAEVLKRADRQASGFDALGFHVVAPAGRIREGRFAKYLVKDHVREIVARRVEQYEGKFGAWYSEWFLPVLEKLEIREISWEEIIENLESSNADVGPLREFYRRCLKWNGVGRG